MSISLYYQLSIAIDYLTVSRDPQRETDLISFTVLYKVVSLPGLSVILFCYRYFSTEVVSFQDLSK